MRVPKYRSTVDGYGFVEYRGKRHYFPGKYNSPESVAAYKAFIRTIASPIEALPDFRPGRQTVASALSVYLKVVSKWVDRQGKPIPEQYHVSRMAWFLLQEFGNTPLDEFSPKALVAVRDRIAETDKVRWRNVLVDGKKKLARVSTGEPVTRSYINEQTHRIRRFFKWAVSEELIPSAVADALAHVSPIKKADSRRGGKKLREGRKVKPAPESAVNASLKHMSPVLKGMAELQNLTGMRPEELCIIRPGDVTRESDVWEYRPGSYKTEGYDEAHGLEKVVYLGPKSQAVLLPFLDRPDDAFCFSPRESVAWYAEQRGLNSRSIKRSPPKTSRRVGEKFTPNSYRQAIKRAIEKAGAPHWFPYQLRHGHGTKVRKVYKLEGAQVALGHARADVTQAYAEKNYELARQIASEIG